MRKGSGFSVVGGAHGTLSHFSRLMMLGKRKLTKLVSRAVRAAVSNTASPAALDKPYDSNGLGACDSSIGRELGTKPCTPGPAWLHPTANPELEKTTRLTLDATAASQTAAVIAMLSRRSATGEVSSSPMPTSAQARPLLETAGGGDAEGPGQAAQCTTISAPAKTSCNFATVACASPARSQVWKASNWAAAGQDCVPGRSKPTTRRPARRNARAVPSPRRPAAPVTTTVIATSRGWSEPSTVMYGWAR
mmetsp:Transcript_102736/g.257614  ORF Transcript_102736/g.257614 Transcript_102736/m.257614 type:complete len:249 (+) Transcript_102736:1558-2304(+)